LMKYEEISTKFRKFFELPSSPVAVKILKTEDKKSTQSPMRFCEMVRKAAVLGDSFTFDVEGLSCTSAELALGFTEPSYGEVYPRIKPAETRFVRLAPLEKCEFEPDVVLVIGNPRKLMRITTVLSQLQGREPVESKFKGEFAVCGECTAIPYIEKKVNLSLLCNGARTFGGYRDEEVVMGFPLPQFVRISEATGEEAITNALCGCIMDDLPAHTVTAIEKLGFGKGTDHFFGKFGKEIIRLYTPKDGEGRITKLTLHVPLKYKDKSSAEAAVNVAGKLLSDPVLHRTRDNWLDIALPVELGETLGRASMRGERFEALIRSALDTISGIVEKVRMKTGSAE